MADNDYLKVKIAQIDKQIEIRKEEIKALEERKKAYSAQVTKTTSK